MLFHTLRNNGTERAKENARFAFIHAFTRIDKHVLGLALARESLFRIR